MEHWNNYGGSVGGPVKKNKLFFFFTYQRNPSSTPTSGLYTYPTAAMEAGDFYGITGSTGAAFSPTGKLLGTYDPVALKLQTYFPGATGKGWVAGCPGPANVSAGTRADLPHHQQLRVQRDQPELSHVVHREEPITIFPTNRSSRSVSTTSPPSSSYVPPDPLYPNDATALLSRGNRQSDRPTLACLHHQPDHVERVSVGWQPRIG